MENEKLFSVGDFVFLFYVESGSIFPGRILEKTIRETIASGLNTEFFLEVYTKEGDEIALISNYNGKRSYRIGAVKVNKSIQKNSDIEALKNGCISVTPISINHTDTAFKNSLEN